MKADFRLMKALADHTRIPPAGRIERLKKFNVRLTQNSDVTEEFKKWNFKLDNQLISFKGRVLDAGNVLVNGQRPYPVRNGDWNFCFPEQAQLCTATLKDWVVIVPNFMMDKAKVMLFERSLFQIKL